MGSIILNGGPNQLPPENALDALLDELKTFSKPVTRSNENLNEEVSNGNSTLTQSTITTQLSQAKLYIQNNSNALIEHHALSDQLTTGDEVLSAQTFIKNSHTSIHLGTNTGTLKRLNSYPSGSDTDVSPTPQHDQRVIKKPPVPERTAELISKVSNKRVPPPPPPRTSSRSPLASPTTNSSYALETVTEKLLKDEANTSSADTSSGNESVNENTNRQVALEVRHQELLKKQKLLQDQYQRLQQISKNSSSEAYTLPLLKTSSESNIQGKMILNLAKSTIGSDTDNEQFKDTLNDKPVTIKNGSKQSSVKPQNSQTTRIKQVYETEII